MLFNQLRITEYLRERNILNLCKEKCITIESGYAMLSLIQNNVVTVHGWISDATFTDIVGLSGGIWKGHVIHDLIGDL